MTIIGYFLLSRFKNDQPLKTDKRVVISKEGRKRKVTIKDAKVTDAGMFKCTSNADETDCELIVNCKCYGVFILKRSHPIQNPIT